MSKAQILAESAGELTKKVLTTTISNVAAVEFNSTYITSDYTHYMIELSELIPATNDTQLRLQMGTANSADTGANYYSMTQAAGVKVGDTDAWYWMSSVTNGFIKITSAWVNEMVTRTGENFNALLKIHNVNSTSAYKTVGNVDSFPSYSEAEMSAACNFLTGTYKNQSAVNYLKLYASSGNLTSGTATLWGVK